MLDVRRWRVEEAEVLGRAIGESLEHLRPWMPWIAEEPVPLAARRLLIERWAREHAAGGDEILAAWEGDVLVAGVGLHRRLGAGALEIGYWVHAARTGRGVATEASRLLADRAFAQPSIDRVEIHHDVANRASRRVPEKLGYARLGDVARAPTAPAETGTWARWRLTRAAWQAARDDAR